MSLNSAPGRTRGAFGLPAAAKRCLFVGRGPRLLWTAGAEVWWNEIRTCLLSELRCCAKNSEAKIAEVEQHTSPNPFGGVSPRVLSFGCRLPLTFKESLGPVSGCCKEQRR